MFSKFFIPFGNFILPLVLWMSNKNQFAFVDHNGKEALNFQISILLYSIVAGLLSIPFFIGTLPQLLDWYQGSFHNLGDFNGMGLVFKGDGNFPGRLLWPLGILGLVQFALAMVNIVFSIMATIRAHDGVYFSYPLTLKFIK